jgi:hypothetical protein
MDPRLLITLNATLNTLLLVLGGLGLAAAVLDWDRLFGDSSLLRRLARRGWLRLAVGAAGAALAVLALVRMTGVVMLPAESGV